MSPHNCSSAEDSYLTQPLVWQKGSCLWSPPEATTQGRPGLAFHPVPSTQSPQREDIEQVGWKHSLARPSFPCSQGSPRPQYCGPITPTHDLPSPQGRVHSVLIPPPPSSPSFSPSIQLLICEFLEVSEVTNDSPQHLREDCIQQDLKAQRYAAGAQ